MVYDEDLEERIDELSADWGLSKKPTFGGLGYFVRGHMTFGIHKNELIIRATEEQGKALLKKHGVHEFDIMKDRTMKTWFMAGGPAIRDDDDLAALLKIGHYYALGLPPKK